MAALVYGRDQRMTLSMQAKLLRVLEGQPFRRVGESKYHDRCARHRRLEPEPEEAVHASKSARIFISVSPSYRCTAPLREHKEDIPELLHHFIQHYNKSSQNILGFTKEADES